MADYPIHKNLQVWSKSISFVKDIYLITRAFPKDEMFGLTSQLRRAAVSIPSNIAEGFERQGNKEFKNFLYIAKGSCGEVRSQLNRAFDFGYINEAVYQQMYNDCKILGSAILHFILSLKSSDFVGTKYHDKSQDSNE